MPIRLRQGSDFKTGRRLWPYFCGAAGQRPHGVRAAKRLWEGTVPVENPLNQWSSAFPALEVVHLLAIVCALGTASVMNLRLMGVGAQTSPSSLWRQTALLTAAGLLAAVFSGLLLFMIAPAEYFENEVFQFKLVALAVAVLFYFTLVRRAALGGRQASLVALVSMLLFSLVPLGGILAGYE